MDGRLNLGIRLLARVSVTLLIFLVLLAGVKAAFAQGQGNAVIMGTVNDSTGVVPGATVTVIDNATGVARTAVSDEQGVFRLLSLPPARYSIKVEVEGFKQLASEVTLLTGETRDLGRLILEVGVLSETIMVTAAATPVQVSRNLSMDVWS